jgi:hypothetical protein
MANQTCNTTDYRCVASCTSDAMCMNQTPKCDTSKMYCVQCLASADCANAPLGKICDTQDNRCVQCLLDSDCSAMTGRTKCNTQANFCVQCVMTADCPMGQTCNQFGMCH